MSLSQMPVPGVHRCLRGMPSHPDPWAVCAFSFLLKNTLLVQQ